MRTVAWLICIHNACAADYWMAWPDHYARGGGLGNQLEQILGRVQCAATNARTMVLPDLRADRSSMRGDARHHAFERVFDVGRLRTVANVATWRDMLTDCNQEVSFVVEGDEHHRGGHHLAEHLAALPVPARGGSAGVMQGPLRGAKEAEESGVPWRVTWLTPPQVCLGVQYL